MRPRAEIRQLVIGKARLLNHSNGFEVKDNRPWQEGLDIDVINNAAIRKIKWHLPRKNGNLAKLTINTNVSNWWDIIYIAFLENFDGQPRLEWYEVDESHGNHPPYGDTIEFARNK
jgi:hypothetical protein